LKILLDATVLERPPTGVAKTTLGLYGACRGLDPGIHILAIHQQPLAVDLPSGFQSVRAASRTPPRLWRSLVLPRRLSGHQPDLVHFPWNGDIPRLPSSHLVATTIHDVLPLEIPGYFRSGFAKWMYKRKKRQDIGRAHVLVTVSEYSRKQIQKHFSPRSEPVVVYPGQTLTVGSSDRPPDRPAPRDYFLYVGGYDPRKGILSLVKTFNGLHRRRKISAKLILTGERRYYSQELRDTIAEGVASNRIEEMGYVSDGVLADLYRNAKALVYPSRYEGFGLPPLEAMSLGCPVITTRHTSIPEVCGDAALYVEPDDERDVSQALIALDKDQALRSDLREKGLRQAAGFTWERAAQDFLSALQSVMEKKTAGRQGAGFAGNPFL
jgi:glycosyltransferase involved in cell wall biosynthesis